MEILKIEDIEKLDKNFLTAEEAARALQISIICVVNRYDPKMKFISKIWKNES